MKLLYTKILATILIVSVCSFGFYKLNEPRITQEIEMADYSDVMWLRFDDKFRQIDLSKILVLTTKYQSFFCVYVGNEIYVMEDDLDAALCSEKDKIKIAYQKYLESEEADKIEREKIDAKLKVLKEKVCKD